MGYNQFGTPKRIVMVSQGFLFKVSRLITRKIFFFFFFHKLVGTENRWETELLERCPQTEQRNLE